MSNTINSDLIRGNINTIILKALYDQDRYGYDIIKEIEVKSRGQYILKQPTLYSCLKRLETQGFIRAYWGTDHSNGGRRKYYTLTDMGKEVFSKNQNEYEYSRTIIDQLISDKDYDLETLLPYIDNGYDDIELPRRVPGGRFDADEPFEAEPFETEPLETDEPLDAEPFETDEPLDAEPLETDEPLDAEPLDADEPLDAEPLETIDGLNTDPINAPDHLNTTDHLNTPDTLNTDTLNTDTLNTDDLPDAGDPFEAFPPFMYAETAAPDELAREDETPEPAALFDASRQAGAGREPAPEEARRAQEDAPLFPGGLAASGYIDNLLTDEGLKSYTAGRDTASPESGSYHFAPPEEYAQNLPPTPGGDLDITASIESFLTSDGESYRSRALREPPAEDEAAAALTPAYTAEKADEPFDESAYYVTPAKAAEKAQKPDYGFLSYHGEPGTTVPSRGGGGSHYIEKAYKSILESIAGDVLGADEQPLPAAEKPTAGTTLKEQIQTRNFGKLSDSIRDLGETAKIRTANTQSLKEYNRRYYYKSNKLMLAQFAIVFVLMLIESFAVFVLIRNGAGVTADHDIVFYVLSIVAAVALPVVGVSLYWGNPNKRKRYDFDFGVTMLYKLIVMLIAALLIYAFNVYLGMPMAVDREHLFSLIMPIVLTTNLPISTLIFNVLYKSGRFTVER